MNVGVYDLSGEAVGSVELDPAVFDAEPNRAVMHQVVIAQLAAARSGTASTKTRAQVRGGGAKPWRQKGTGRARQGSIRAPQWPGGGVVFGPHPRDYAQRTPKKMVRLALRGALSDRARGERIRVLDALAFDAPSTKQAKKVLATLGMSGRVLIVISDWDDDDVAVRSFRNLPEVHIIPGDQMNAYDVLRNEWIVFSRKSLDVTTAKVSGAKIPEAVVAGEEDA
jgi:large subunit ribosomal protein L4